VIEPPFPTSKIPSTLGSYPIRSAFRRNAPEEGAVTEKKPASSEKVWATIKPDRVRRES